MAAILMIDDERAILELVKNGLQKDGHFVTAYTSAAQVPLDKLNRDDSVSYTHLSFQRENRDWHWQRRSFQSVKAAE